MTTERATCWSLTINNPTQKDYEEIDLARQKGWRVEGQLEQGAEGTKHLQLKLSTPQVRFSAVKKSFSRAHIEIARNPAALGTYVAKEDTRVAGLPTTQDKYPSLSRFWHLVATHWNADHDQWTYDDKDAFDAHVSQQFHRASLFRDTMDTQMESNPLRFLDTATEHLIAEGYHVESIATNPSVRLAWKKWWRSICYRALETARQTDMRSEAQEVNVPMVHNHADEPSHTETADGVLEGIDRQEGTASLEGHACRQVPGTPSTEGSGDYREDSDEEADRDAVHRR